MNLLMISGDRSILQGKKSAFWYTLQGMRRHWNRIDIICPFPDAARGVQPIGFGSDHAGNRRSTDFGGVYFHPNPSRSLFTHPFWIAKKGAELHRIHGCTVATVHEYPPFYNGIGAALLRRKTGIPCVTEIHHIVGHPVPADMTERIAFLLSRMLLRFDCAGARAVRTVNATVREMLIAWGVPAEKVHIVSSFYLDTKLLREAPMPPIAYDVAFCARLVANKGLDALLKAAVILSNLRLIVIGDGPLRSSYERFVREHGLEGRVTFTGWMPNREGVVEAMKSARMFVMNSTSEGGPRVLLEAMGAGLPVIATKVGIAPDVIVEGKNGLFSDGTAEDLAGKISFLLNDESLRFRMGAAACAVLDRYDGDTLVDAYCQFLKSCR